VYGLILSATYYVAAEERIVGGRAVEGNERPPFMAIFNFHPGSSVKCSSSIITSHFIISAAHCIVSKSHIMDGSCLSKYKQAKFKTECEEQENGDMKMIFPEQEEESPEVYINIDYMQEEVKDAEKKFLVDYIISHRDGYKGGKYGDYGGYDVIIVKTRKSMPDELKACLPGPDYSYTSPMIGGYGRYRRVPCEVNDLGPSVYQYCKVDKECTKDQKEFKKAQCDVRFDYKDKDTRGCIKNEETPSASDPECLSFRKEMKYTDKTMTRNKVNEIVIIDEDDEIISKCYRNDAGKYGWCGTTQHIVDGKFDDGKDLSVAANSGWGFCDDTCEDKDESHITGRARVKEVEIVSQDYCDKKLNKLRIGKPDFQVFPKVYCVAYNETYQTEFYRKESDGVYKLLPNSDELHQNVMKRENPWYIRATGSCKGDSGGPLYEKSGDDYVLLGSTSRGIGSLANCGGIDNPTHYVRMQDMMDWIKSYTKDEDLCIKE